MPHFECVECNTGLRSTSSEADPIGDLCPVRGSLVEAVGDVREIGGTALSRHAAAHCTAARKLIADRVGEIIARRKFRDALIRLEIERYDANSVSHTSKRSAVALPAPAKS
jgi:hypothetical protein